MDSLVEKMNAIQLRKNLNSETVAILACENHGADEAF